MNLKLHRQFELGSWEDLRAMVVGDFHDVGFIYSLQCQRFDHRRIILTGDEDAAIKFQLFKHTLAKKLANHGYNGKLQWSHQ